MGCCDGNQSGKLILEKLNARIYTMLVIPGDFRKITTIVSGVGSRGSWERNVVVAHACVVTKSSIGTSLADLSNYALLRSIFGAYWHLMIQELRHW